MFNHALIALYYAYLLFIRTTAEECSESVNTTGQSHKKSVSFDTLFPVNREAVIIYISRR